LGFLFIQEGRLIAAQSPRSEGEHAAYEIMAWDDASIEIGNLRDTTKKTMDFPLGHMMMEAFRIKDESEKNKSDGISPETIDSELGALDEFSLDDPLEDRENHNLQETEKEETMSNLNETLKGMAQMEGIKAVCLVGRDGFLIDSISTTGMDAETVGAIASSGFGSSERMGREIGQGGIEMVMFEYEGGPVMLSPIGEEAFLVVIAEKSVNLGLIRVKIRKHSGELVTAVSV
jgi:predicted regulator of Ras-like GTPase activity (Roadblock/LC7/MglB family)